MPNVTSLVSGKNEIQPDSPAPESVPLAPMNHSPSKLQHPKVVSTSVLGWHGGEALRQEHKEIHVLALEELTKFS